MSSWADRHQLSRNSPIHCPVRMPQYQDATYGWSPIIGFNAYLQAMIFLRHYHDSRLILERAEIGHDLGLEGKGARYITSIGMTRESLDSVPSRVPKVSLFISSHQERVTFTLPYLGSFIHRKTLFVQTASNSKLWCVDDSSVRFPCYRRLLFVRKSWTCSSFYFRAHNFCYRCHLQVIYSRLRPVFRQIPQLGHSSYYSNDDLCRGASIVSKFE